MKTAARYTFCTAFSMIASSLLPLATACSRVSTEGSLGTPIAVLHGDLSQVSLQSPEGRHRAAFGWLALGGSALASCLDQSEGFDAIACLRLPIEFSPTLYDTEINSIFPSAFEIPLWRLPSQEVLVGHDGSTLAFGGVIIYDDRNRNLELDLVDASAIEATDRVAASSIAPVFGPLGGPLGTYVVLREGPTHPLWSLLQTAAACPDLPLGISVVTLERSDAGLSCKLVRDGSLSLSAASEGLGIFITCSGLLTQLPFPTRYPATPPPPNAIVHCRENGEILVFWEDHGRYCDPAQAIAYSLRRCSGTVCGAVDANAGEWDLTNNPPTWWPCH